MMSVKVKMVILWEKIRYSLRCGPPLRHIPRKVPWNFQISPQNFQKVRQNFREVPRNPWPVWGILPAWPPCCPGAAAWPAATAVGPAALAAPWGGNVGIPKIHPGVKIRRNSVQIYAFFTEKTCKVCRFQPFAVPLSFDLPCHSVRWPTMVGQPLAWQGRYRTHFVFFRERCLSLPTLTFHFPIV